MEPGLYGEEMMILISVTVTAKVRDTGNLSREVVGKSDWTGRLPTLIWNAGMRKSWCELAGKKYGKLTSAKIYGYRKGKAGVNGAIS